MDTEIDDSTPLHNVGFNREDFKVICMGYVMVNFATKILGEINGRCTGSTP